MKTHFKAPWGTGLKWSSALVTVILIGVSVCDAFFVPALRKLGTGIWFPVLLPPVCLLSMLPFVVRGFTIQNGTLLVHRLWWNTEISLSCLQSAEVISNACRGSLRTCGNGGGFSNTGYYWSKSLGHYRAFVNDWKRAVVLRWPHKTIVLSCDDPESFVSAVTPP